jgi:hypothetical protein
LLSVIPLTGIHFLYFNNHFICLEKVPFLKYASKYGCAGVLYQVNPDTGIWEPVACVSHKFSQAAQKWSGSVEDGIAWLRSLDAIVIHPDCKNAIFEIPRYSWKVDKLTGDILPVPASGWDHVSDFCRYACNKFIKRQNTVWDAM